MARPTTTRTDLRRQICLELAMPFFRRRADGYSTPTATGTTTTLIDTTLTQADDYWNNQWLYIPESAASSDVNGGEARLISDFVSTTGTLTLEEPLLEATSTTYTYEIQTVYNAVEIHNAINRAIGEAFPAFFETGLDETIVVQEDKLTYGCSDFEHTPWMISKIYVERNHTVKRGQVTGGITTTVLGIANFAFNDSDMDLSNVNSNWKVSFYAGMNAGLLGDIVHVDTTIGQMAVHVPDSDIPAANSDVADTTTKYAIWNTMDEYRDWYRIYAVRFDKKEYPDILYFPTEMLNSLGLRLRVEYAYVPAKLTTDAGTTVVPADYIIPKALQYLYTGRMKDNRADRQKYAQLAQEMERAAVLYKQNNQFRINDLTIWQEGDRAMLHPIDNPLGWGE